MTPAEQMARRENARTRAHWDEGFDAELEIVMTGITYNRETLDKITYRTAKAAGITVDQILGDRIFRVYARARSFAMWKARQAGYSLLEVAHYFNRDYSTVIKACQKIEERLSQGTIPTRAMSLTVLLFKATCRALNVRRT